MTPTNKYRLVPTKSLDAIWSTTRLSHQNGNYITKEVCLPLYNQNRKTEKEKEEDGIYSVESSFCSFLLYGSQAISDSHVANTGANRNTTGKH